MHPNTKHGLCYTRAYKCAASAIQRCHNPRSPSYSRYGARGVYVWGPWRKNIGAFAVWLGEPPSDKHTIDRKDGTKGYVPGNVRWADKREQSMNRKAKCGLPQRRFKYNGAVLCITELAEVSGVPKATIRDRLKRGWTVEQAVSIAPSYRNCLDKAQRAAGSTKFYVTINGIKSSFRSVCLKNHINEDTGLRRLRLGWDMIRACTQPARKMRYA